MLLFTYFFFFVQPWKSTYADVVSRHLGKTSLRRGVMSDGLGGAIEICMHKMYEALRSRRIHSPSDHDGRISAAEEDAYTVWLSCSTYALCSWPTYPFPSGLQSIHIHGHGYCTVTGPSTFSCIFPGAGNRKIPKLQTAGCERYILEFSQLQQPVRWQFPL